MKNNKEREIVKVTKLKNQYIRKIALIFLWIILGFILVRGIGTIIRPNPINLTSFKNEINNEIDKNSKETQGSAFAENFAYEYFRFNGDEKEYTDRLKKYTDLEFKAKLQKMDVVYVNKIKSKWRTKDLLIVDLKVGIVEVPDLDNYFKKFLPTPTKKTTPKPTPTTKKVSLNEKPKIMLLSYENTSIASNVSSTGIETAEDILYVRISVEFKINNIRISGYPTFINNPDSKGNGFRKLPGNVLKEEKETKEIEELVLNFLDSYYQGNKIEMSYFLKDKDAVVNLLNGEYKVKDIIKKEMNKKDNKYYVRIVYTVEYKMNLFDNGMEFILSKEDDKLLIDEYNTSIN